MAAAATFDPVAMAELVNSMNLRVNRLQGFMADAAVALTNAKNAAAAANNLAATLQERAQEMGANVASLEVDVERHESNAVVDIKLLAKPSDFGGEQDKWGDWACVCE